MESDKRDAVAREQIRVGAFLLALGIVLLIIVAAASHTFEVMKEVLLLREVISVLTALPAYGLLLFAIGLIGWGLLGRIRAKMLARTAN